jgi:hypothetical protein
MMKDEAQLGLVYSVLMIYWGGGGIFFLKISRIRQRGFGKAVFFWQDFW